MGQLVEHIGARRVGDVQVVGEGCAVGGGTGEWVLLVGLLCRETEGRIWVSGVPREGTGSCRLLCRKQAAQLAPEAKPDLCAPSLALGQSLRLSASLKLQATHVLVRSGTLLRGLAFTVPTPAESQSLQGPFACLEQLRGLGLVYRRDPGSGPCDANTGALTAMQGHLQIGVYARIHV